METRRLVLAGRFAAILAVLAMRGGARAAAWGAHDLLWLYPTLRRNCGWHGEVLTHFHTTERAIWLTIDDGPDAESTPAILDLLAQHRAKATFFAIGRQVEENAVLCRRIVSEGHAVEVHTYSHPVSWWWLMPRPLVRSEIERGYEAIISATGRAPRFFRSPVGMNNLSVHPVAKSLGLRVAGWSVDGGDGCPAAPTSVVTRILRAIRPGAIVLVHENGQSRHRLLTLKGLREKLAKAGYRCVLPAESVLC